MAKLVDREIVRELVKQGAQLVEVLPAEEFAEEHLPGAISHPLRQLDEEAAQVDRKRAVIVYCWDAA